MCSQPATLSSKLSHNMQDAFNHDGGAWLYHERQEAGLCAVHALNALLQERIFTEVDLMQLAHECDRREREVMAALGTETPEFLQYMAEDSGNVADDGNYSVQVIQEALKVWNLTLVPLTNPEMTAAKQNPTTEQAFVCNLASHWLTIRKVGPHWYNFNSLLPEPQHLSPFYLSAFLDTLLDEGYSIFCVKGNLCQGQPPLSDGGSWVWIRYSGGAGRGGGDSESRQLEMAIAASLQQQQQSSMETSNKTNSNSAGNGEDDELLMAIALSLVTLTPISLFPK